MKHEDRPDLAVFVNTSDGFRDCWDPFFKLWKINAGETRDLPIYLNTERATYNSDDLNIVATCVWNTSETERLSWSTCIQRGLDAVEQTYILYMQEDYFLTSPIRHDWMFRAMEFLNTNPDIDVVYLNKYGPVFSTGRSLKNGFVIVPHDAKYVVSTQAAIWRKSALRQHTRAWENGWMFEKFGSWRAKRSNRTFLSVAPDIMNGDPVIDYLYTGVMKGQWHSGCVDLFAANGISVDFSKRGFYKDAGRLKTKYEVVKKLVGQPLATARSVKSLWTTSTH